MTTNLLTLDEAGLREYIVTQLAIGGNVEGAVQRLSKLTGLTCAEVIADAQDDLEFIAENGIDL